MCIMSTVITNLPAPLQGKGARLGSLLPSRSGEGFYPSESALPLSNYAYAQALRLRILSPEGERGHFTNALGAALMVTNLPA